MLYFTTYIPNSVVPKNKDIGFHKHNVITHKKVPNNSIKLTQI